MATPEEKINAAIDSYEEAFGSVRNRAALIRRLVVHLGLDAPEIEYQTAPPSIAEMAPGTTFVATPYSSVLPMHFRVTGDNDVHSCGQYKLRESRTGGGWHAWAIDPSTIRDVVLP